MPHFLPWRRGNKGWLGCAQTLCECGFSCLFAQPAPRWEGGTLLLDRGQQIPPSSFWHVSFCLWKTPSAGLQNVMSKDRLAPGARRGPCQGADSWRASSAAPCMPTFGNQNQFSPKPPIQSLKRSHLLPWGCRPPGLAQGLKGSVTLLVTLSYYVEESR